MKEVNEILKVLRRANRVFGRADSDQQARLFKALQSYFDRLVELGARPGTGEALLVFGKDFLMKESPGLAEKMKGEALLVNVQRVFGIKAYPATFGESAALRVATMKSATVFRVDKYYRKGGEIKAKITKLA